MRWLVVLLALAFVPAAAAKGPFQVCGSSGCAILSDETQLPLRLFGLPEGTATLDAPQPAPYYIVKFAGIGDTLAYWVPSSGVLRIVPQNAGGAWVRTLASEDALLREKAAGLKPYPAPTRVTAYVDYEPVKRAAGWLQLYTVGRPVTVSAQRPWLEVWLRGGHSPWNDGASRIWISRTGSYLMRDGVTVALPKQIADRVRRRLPLP
jgi:hypothetical protein